MNQATKEIQDLMQSQGFRAQWRQVFDCNEFKAVFEAMRKSCRAISLPGLTPGVHHDTTIAHEYHRLIGNNEVLDLMEKIAKGDLIQQDREIDNDFEHYSQQQQPQA